MDYKDNSKDAKRIRRVIKSVLIRLEIEGHLKSTDTRLKPGIHQRPPKRRGL